MYTFRLRQLSTLEAMRESVPPTSHQPNAKPARLERFNDPHWVTPASAPEEEVFTPHNPVYKYQHGPILPCSSSLPSPPPYSSPPFLSLETMKLLICLYLPLLLSLHRATSMEDQQCSNPANVEEVCKTIGASMGADEYDYCVRTLKSDPKSKSTDLHGLATLATGLAVSHAMSTESKIEELMDLESDPEIKEGYQACLDAYNDAIDQLQDALDNLNSKLYFAGMSLLRSTLKGVESCEEAFKDMKSSPIIMQDKDYQRLANIAYHITASVE